MTTTALVGAVLVAVPLVLLFYAYFLYPAILWLLSRRPSWRPPPGEPEHWPPITILLPVHNEERILRATLEAILAIDYPADRRQILVLSDASTDGTHAIAEEFADRGVELLVQPRRQGKTAAENASLRVVRGEIIVSTDATTRILPGSVKPLVSVFRDRSVGVASGQDVSAAAAAQESNASESGYVGYEMWVRDLETRLGTIVGASGCFMAIRQELFDELFPIALSRDFASPLLARRAGYRAVSVPEAKAVVPRTPGLQVERRRKTRTMARGLETLWFMRELLNPVRYGRFAVMLWSHKVARWVAFLAAPLGLLGLALLAVDSVPARVVLIASLAGLGLGFAAFLWPASRPPPRVIATLGYAVGSFAAALSAWVKALRGEHSPIWEPTRR